MNDIQQMVSDEFMKEALEELTKQITPTISLKKVMGGKLENMKEYVTLRSVFKNMDANHPQFKEARYLLRNFERPTNKLGRETFEMNPDNYYFDDETGISYLLGKDPWEKEKI
ncbi:TPA: hypothetical protein N3288_000220 [Klebsiella aerogenes]|nr:hypothetical protein [Klebsiella aerogenes]